MQRVFLRPPSDKCPPLHYDPRSRRERYSERVITAGKECRGPESELTAELDTADDDAGVRAHPGGQTALHSRAAQGAAGDLREDGAVSADIKRQPGGLFRPAIVVFVKRFGRNAQYRHDL